MKRLPLPVSTPRGSLRAPMMFFGLVALALMLAGCATPAAPKPPAQTVAAPTIAPASSQSATVSAKNTAFNPKELTVKAGTTVIWHNDDSVRHTVTSDTGLFDGNLPAGADFQYAFSQPGTYPYHCTPHGGAGGQGMSGVIIVQ